MANQIVKIAGGKSAEQASRNLEVYLDISSDSKQKPGTPSFSFGGFMTYLVENCEDLSSYTNITDRPEFQQFCQKIEKQIEVNDGYRSGMAVQSAYEIFQGRVGVESIENAYREYLDQTQYLVDKLVNVRAVQNSLHQIFTWIPGERILNPEFGSRLRFYLYEQLTEENQQSIIMEIRNSVSKWEPRVVIDDIRKTTTVDNVENNTVTIDVVYRIKGLDDEQFHYTFTPKTRVIQ